MLALRAVSVKLVWGCTGAADVRQRLMMEERPRRVE